MTSTCPFSNLISQNKAENFVASVGRTIKTNVSASIECHLEPAVQPLKAVHLKLQSAVGVFEKNR